MPLIHFTKIGRSTWVVPADWNNNNNYINCIGGGGSGMPGGGGGGGFAQSNNVTLRPGQTVWIQVGNYGSNGTAGGPSWVCYLANSSPGNSSVGIYAEGGGGVPYYTTTGAGGGHGIFGTSILHNGGAGSSVNFGLLIGGFPDGGAGGGAGGPHGDGQNGNYNTDYGGAGDAGYGGAGGTPTAGYYQAINNGGNSNANSPSGGGGADNTLFDIAGIGGNFGGGGAGNDGGSQGGQGIATINYTPYVAPANTPALPPPNNIIVTPPPPIAPSPPPPPPPAPPPPPPPPPPPCVPNGYATATEAQIYWAYGTWVDQFGYVSSGHYDTNYKQLVSLAGDNDTASYDIQYNSTLPWNFVNEQENFYLDYPRIWKSRSNEWIEDNGAKSVWMRHRTIIGDPDCVPNIDPPSGYVTALTNLLFLDEQTYGYRLTYSNNFGYFQPGDIVTQQLDGNTNVSGTVYMMDPTYLYIHIPVGGFFAGYTVMNAYNPAINAYVTASVEMNEKYSANVFPGQSRYISKSTLLSTGQDAEDLQVFMTAYRPANSNFKVYGKILSSSDPGNYSDRIWSRLTESNNTSTSFSSLTNPKDFVSIMFDFPTSQLLFSNLESCACDANTLYVTVPTATQFAAGDYIYLSSPGQGTFNIRQIITIPNNSTLAISSTPSFSNTANLNVGIIPNLEDPTGAFLYDQNSNIVRYVTNNDVSFDMFNQFAVKIVPISDNPVVCPTVTEFRAVALQATA